MSDQDRIPAGRYVGRCTGPKDAQFGYAGSGGEQIGLLFQLLNEGFEGEQVAWFGSFTGEQATTITMRTLRDCGWQGTDITDLTGIDQNEVDVVIKYETFEGKRRMKVGIWPPGGAVVMKKPMDDAQKRAFAARMKGAAMASKSPAPANGRPPGGGGGGSAQRPPPNFGGQTAKQQSADDFGAYGGGSDDDVPFVSSRPGRWGV